MKLRTKAPIMNEEENMQALVDYVQELENENKQLRENLRQIIFTANKALEKGAKAGGAAVTPNAIVAYPKANGILGDWHGKPIGTWRAVSTWRTPRSFFPSTMSQIEATVDGITYTGRGAGEGMVYHGSRKK